MRASRKEMRNRIVSGATHSRVYRLRRSPGGNSDWWPSILGSIAANEAQYLRRLACPWLGALWLSGGFVRAAWPPTNPPQAQTAAIPLVATLRTLQFDS